MEEAVLLVQQEVLARFCLHRVLDMKQYNTINVVHRQRSSLLKGSKIDGSLSTAVKF